MSFVGSVAAFADIPRTDTNDMSIATISGMENLDSPFLIDPPTRIPLFLLRGRGGYSPILYSVSVFFLYHPSVLPRGIETFIYIISRSYFAFFGL